LTFDPFASDLVTVDFPFNVTAKLIKGAYTDKRARDWVNR